MLGLSSVTATDWPQWGGGPTKNPVSLEKGVPLDFQLPIDGNPARGIAWSAEIAPWNSAPPVVADGLVWVGTRGVEPADEKLDRKADDWDGGLLLCLRESDGKVLWKHLTPRHPDGYDWDNLAVAIGSAPLVEGDRLWYVNNRCEVVCFDIGPLKKGTGLPKELWKMDMRNEFSLNLLQIFHDHGYGACIASYQDTIYTITRHQLTIVERDPTKLNNIKKPNINAPSLVCLEKATGKVVWTDNSPGKNILFQQMSSPLVAEIKGRPQVIVGQGDGWLRSFEPATGKLIWKCDLNTKDAVWNDGPYDRCYPVAPPILYENRVYITTGSGASSGGSDAPGALCCIDPTKEGDISAELDNGPKKGKPNPNSGVIWRASKTIPPDAPRIETGLKVKRDMLRSDGFLFAHSLTGCVAHDGLVYAADKRWCLYCFDAVTGKLYWGEVCNEIRGPLLWADGMVLATGGESLHVFAHGKEKKRLANIELNASGLPPGPVFANGTLYVTTSGALHAIRKPK